MTGSKRRAVFLDRDGTLNVEVDYLGDPERFEWIPGTLDALSDLHAAGFQLVVITNQSGVARGYFTEDDVARVHDRMCADLAQRGIELAGIYYCPFHPDVGEPPYRKDADCRKPKPGMFLQALRELDIDAEQSFCVGDSARDLEAGRAAGISGILVATGKGASMQDKVPTGTPYVPDLAHAAQWILARA